MKKYLIIILLGIIYLNAKSQEIFSVDFSVDPKNEFIVWDIDKNTPTAAMQKVGFKIDYPWVKIKESNKASNWCFGSTSSYEPAGQANDWLVTKGIYIQGEGCVLEWKSQAYDPEKRDGLKIFISTKGQFVADFPDSPEWEIEEESAGISPYPDIIEGDGEWTQHSISLDKFAGQTIYIAFVNQSNDKSMILIDDIWVGKHLNYSFSNQSGEYTSSSEVEIKGTFTVTGNVTINNYTVHYSYAGKEFSKEYNNLNLSQNDSHEFILEEKIPLTMHQTIEYKLWFSQGEKNSLYTTNTITRISHFPKRTVVIEEGTGTWCQYCVTGIWAMEHLYEISKEDKDFIGIAVHNGDAMMDRDYNRELGLNSFPTGVINRKISSSPLGDSFADPWGGNSWVTRYQKERQENTFCDINVEGTYNNDSTKIMAKATVTSVLPVEKVEYRVAFVLLENGITGYSQRNAYAGAPYEVGGFEKMPNPCYPAFNDVARGIWPEFKGSKTSMPPTLEADQPIEYSYEITIPKAVENRKNLRLVALLLNGPTQEILNASIYAMTNESDIRTSSIANIITDESDIQTEIKNGNLSVCVNTDNKVDVCLFDITGKVINKVIAEGKTWFSISINGYKGMGLLQIKEGSYINTKKIIF